MFCLWGTDVSRAYVFQASRPAEGGDNPPPHTKGENMMFDSEQMEISFVLCLEQLPIVKEGIGFSVNSLCYNLRRQILLFCFIILSSCGTVLASRDHLVHSWML